jgi:hypothetical protein
VTARTVKTLALDVEGTLISNAISLFPRPGLYRFLDTCREMFPHLVVYTGVREERFRRLAYQLISEENAPRWFGNLPHIHWSDAHKDLRQIPDSTLETTLIVDDFEGCIHPDQIDRWIPIEPFERPYSSSDTELTRVMRVLANYAESS